MQFVKKLWQDFGDGWYSVIKKGKGRRRGFQKFWKGYIAQNGTRFQRLEGNVAPWLKSSKPVGSWHDIMWTEDERPELYEPYQNEEEY